MGDPTVVAFGALTLVGLVFLGLGALRRSRNLLVLGWAILFALAGTWILGLIGVLIGIAILGFLRRSGTAKAP